MSKLYAIEVMGSDHVVIVSREDVQRLVAASNAGAKLVRVRDALINPSSISLIRRSYDAVRSDLGQDDPGLIEGPDNTQQLT